MMSEVREGEVHKAPKKPSPIYERCMEYFCFMIDVVTTQRVTVTFTSTLVTSSCFFVFKFDTEQTFVRQTWSLLEYCWLQANPVCQDKKIFVTNVFCESQNQVIIKTNRMNIDSGDNHNGKTPAHISN